MTDRALCMTGRHRGGAGLSRRAFLGGAAALGTAAALPALPVAATAAEDRRHRGGFRVSLSVSPFTEAVLGSLALTDGRRTASTVREVQRLFNQHGATEVFVRVATRTQARLGDAEYGLARALERARLARDLGLPLNPELGLWAVYGDITRQPAPDFSDYPSIRLPGPWNTLTLEQMEAALRQYGALAARQLLATGVRVNHWDLGNEVEWGVAGVAIKSGQMGPPFAWNNTQAGYRQTPDGQDRYLRDLVAQAAATAAVAGIRPWAPDYCLASGGWEPMSLFTEDGIAKPALSAIEDSLLAARMRSSDAGR